MMSELYDFDLMIKGQAVNIRPAPDQSFTAESANPDVLTVFRHLIDDNLSLHSTGQIESERGKHKFRVFARGIIGIKEQTIPNVDTNHMSPQKAMIAIAKHIEDTYPNTEALHTEAEKIHGMAIARITNQQDQFEAKRDTLARTRTAPLADMLDKLVTKMLNRATMSGEQPEWNDADKEALREALSKWYKLEQQRAARERT